MALDEIERQPTPKNTNVENQQLNVVNLEALAKEIMKILKRNLREENERLPR